MDHHTGSCLCGAVTLRAEGAPLRIGICHCRDCRRHHGAVFYGAAIFPEDRVAVAGETRSYRGRHFCPTCGSSVFARSGDEIEVHLGVLDNPDALPPDYEVWTLRRAAWLPPFPVSASHLRDRDEDS